MADEEKERAEKLAAARKKFEQAKKKQKDGKKTVNKKPSDKSTSDKKLEDDAELEDTKDDAEPGDTTDAVDEKAVKITEDKSEALDAAQTTTAEPALATTTDQTESADTEPDSFTQELHRQQTSRIEELESENRSLKEQLAAGTQPATINEEIERLQARIRDLEAENFDLRRGIWRDKRGDIQSNTEQDGLLEYEDVDLNSPYGPRSSSFTRPAHSTLQDVINSGISAFTGRPFEPPRKSSTNNASRPRKQSLGLLSEDGFDEEAFRLAQEEEAKRRIERVKDVKRALPQWKGWRIDLVELRQGFIGSGGREVEPIFEV